MLKVTRHLLTTLMIALAVSSFSAEEIQGQDPARVREADELELNKLIERQMSGEEVHSYFIRVREKEFLRVVVDQRGIDVVVTLFGPPPTGKQLVEVDSPNGPKGPEPLQIIAEEVGTYRLEIRSLEKVAAGKYAVTLMEKHAVTEADRERIAKQRLVDQAQGMIGQADALRAAGRFDEGIPIAERAIEIFRANLASDNELIANALNSLGLLHYNKGNVAHAESLYQQALKIYEKIYDAEHPAIAAVLHNLAGVADVRSDFASVEALENRSLTMYEKALGKEHIQVAIILNALGQLNYKKGDYSQAQSLYQRAMSIHEKMPNPDLAELAFLVHNFADLYEAKGDRQQAEQFFRRALSMRESALSKEHPDLAFSLHGLGGILEKKGEFAEAESLHKRGLEIRKKALGPEHPFVGNSLYYLAVPYYQQGDYKTAERLIREAITIYEKRFGSQHTEVGTGFDNLAHLYHKKGDYKTAESLRQKALEIYQNAFGKDHRLVALLLTNKAVLLEEVGAFSRALQSLERAQEIREANLKLILGTGSLNQKQLYLDSLAVETAYVVSFNVSLQPRNDLACRLALTTILRRKGRALDAMVNQIATLRTRAEKEDRAIFDRLIAIQSHLANLQIFDTGRLSAGDRTELVSKLRTQLESLEDQVGQKSAEYRVEAQSITLESVQRAIPPEAALVEIFTYQPYVPLRGTNKFGKPRYVAYVVRRDMQTPRFVDLGPAATIESNVAELRAALQNPRRKDVTKISRRVDRLVMEPVRRLVGNAEHLLIAPDGALNLIPFSALMDQRGKYLVERYAISYLTSGRDLLRFKEHLQSRNNPLVIADPMYGLGGSSTKAGESAQATKTTLSVDFTLLNYKPLAGTVAEANSICELWPSAQSLQQENATELALKKYTSPGFLHVATHGFFLSDKRQRSEIPRELNRGTYDTLKGLSISNEGWENPLLRSGLVLAGVKQGRSGEGEDGVLTALEVAGLDLWGTKLVVFSACETGLGEVKNSAGVYGLRRALVLAGSETQVISLWKVSDVGTKDLMKAYYTELQRGHGRMAALRKVQLTMLRGQLKPTESRGKRGTINPGEKVATKDYRHPYYWAAFIQSGDWRSMDTK
jgi:CHAT domain-containing protein/Tfp pilus assembly protein PilF